MKPLLLEAGEINFVYMPVDTGVALVAILNVPYYRMFFGQQENNILLGSHLLRAVRRGCLEQNYNGKAYFHGEDSPRLHAALSFGKFD